MTWNRNGNLGKFTNFVNLLNMCGIAVPSGILRGACREAKRTPPYARLPVGISVIPLTAPTACEPGNAAIATFIAYQGRLPGTCGFVLVQT